MLKLKQGIKTIEHLLPLLLATRMPDNEAKEEFKETPTCLAAYRNSAEVPKLLIQHNVEIEGQGRDATLLLHLNAYIKTNRQ